MKPKSKILIIAGSDSSGGAGIQADIKTVSSLGSYAMTAVTAITSQNSTGILSIVSITKFFSPNLFFARSMVFFGVLIDGIIIPWRLFLVIKSLYKLKIFIILPSE